MPRVPRGRHVVYVPPDTPATRELPSVTRVPRGRHVVYVPPDTPATRELPSVTCLDNLPEFLGGRHFSYTVHNVPLTAWDWACCDAFCTPEEIAAGDCYKVPTCYTLGPGPGIAKRIALYAFDAASCWSARGIIDELTYDAADDKWRGVTLALRGGSIAVEFECVPGLPNNDPDKFKLTLTGACLPTNPTVLTAGYQCSDPLMIAFPQFTAGDCCQCNGNIADPPYTTEPGEVQIFVATNCRPPRIGRHIRYDGDAFTPVTAHARNCQWDQLDDYVCGNMKCPLTATVTNVTDCACLAGGYNLDYINTQWVYTGTMGGCGSAGEIVVTCTDNGDGTVTLHVDVTCGANNVGTADITIPGHDLEDLDETVTIDMTDPTPTTCGTCTFQWNEMAMAWSQISANCTGDCTCVDEMTIPPGTVDGEQITLPCDGSYVVPCCIGRITVRLMRAA